MSFSARQQSESKKLIRDDLIVRDETYVILFIQEDIEGSELHVFGSNFNSVFWSLIGAENSSAKAMLSRQYLSPYESIRKKKDFSRTKR